jgi:hypothetical protein
MFIRHFYTALLLASLASRAFSADTNDQLAFFESKIRPVLAQNCFECHSAQAQQNKKLKAGLLLDSKAGVLHGGETGPALVAGKPAESLLMKVLRHEIKGAEMPPKGALPAGVIADFAKWIEMGAADPRSGAAPVVEHKRVIDVKSGQGWWAFRPLAAPALPKVKNNAWIQTPVDAFILAQQEAKGLSPNSLAAKEQLLRRATFDLTGLAPTAEEQAAFLQDSSADAYERLVDRLLASKHYGERWGRHWLDVVRFAESNGYEFDAFRAGAYHYRDWVIDALNADMPYDQFIRMQLAGDKLMPGELDGARAVGFLVAGPYPGQITAKTREKIRYDQIDDMVSTIGSGMLGVSMGCVRCHDHKFDPLPQKDYYGIAAALATTVHSPEKIDLKHAETQKLLVRHNAAAAPLLAALKQYETHELPKRLAAWKRDDMPKLAASTPWQIFDVQSATAQKARLTSDRDGHVIYLGNKEKDDTYTIKVVTYQKGIRAFRLDAFSDPTLPNKGPGLSDNGNFVLGDVKIIARPLDKQNKTKPVTLDLAAGAVTFEQKRFEFAQAVDNSPNTGWGVAPKMGKDHAATFEVEGDAAGFEGGTEFEVQLRFSGFFGLGKLRLAFAQEAKTALTAEADMQSLRELQSMPAAATADALVTRWFARIDPQAKKLLAAIAEHEKKRPQPLLTEVYTTKQGGEDVYFLRRGEVDRKEGKATPDFIQVLMRNGSADKWTGTPKPKEQPKHPRSALGDWMTDAHSGGGPLLARVIANRVWRFHFGRGIVATPNDLGTQGTPPTHPELLEHLAERLVAQGWKLKPLHREIMLSATYMQSGAMSEGNQRLDPDNQLWWYRPARRLEAESIRDALLQLGGRLDPAMHGPSITDVASPRRSVYLRVKRSELVPFLTMFDAPEPTQSIGDRGNTTVPTQALTVMNSPFVRDMATRFATRIKAAKPEQTIAQAFQLAFCRQPTPAETQRLTAYLQAQQQLGAKSPEVELCLALLSLNEFIYVD